MPLSEDGKSYHCTFSGDGCGATDVDALARIYLLLQEEKAKLTGALAELAQHFASLCDGDDVTRRVRGQDVRVKVVASDVYWDQSMLSGLRMEYPNLAQGIIVPTGQVRVVAVEYDKVLRETGDERFLAFRAELQKACRGRVGLPRVSVEQLP